MICSPTLLRRPVILSNTDNFNLLKDFPSISRNCCRCEKHSFPYTYRPYCVCVDDTLGALTKCFDYIVPHRVKCALSNLQHVLFRSHKNGLIFIHLFSHLRQRPPSPSSPCATNPSLLTVVITDDADKTIGMCYNCLYILIHWTVGVVAFGRADALARKKTTTLWPSCNYTDFIFIYEK